MPRVLQAKNERNYHIFYEMLAGLPSQQKQAFYLQEAETYYYLNQVEDSLSLIIIIVNDFGSRPFQKSFSGHV